MRLSTLLFCLALLTLVGTGGIAASPGYLEGWKLESDVGGIKVYSRAVQGSQFRQIKAVASVDAPYEAVVGILTDYVNYKLWMNNVTDSQVIEDASPTIKYVYTYEDTPWPVQNRFCVSKMTVNQEQDRATIEFQSVPRFMKSPRDAIEFISYRGYWQINRSKTGCDIEYLLEANPGGHVPSWLANELNFGGPARSIRNLKNLAENRSRP